MMYATTNTYAMKRDIIGFSEKLSAGLYRPDCKFAGRIATFSSRENPCIRRLNCSHERAIASLLLEGHW